MNAAQPGKRIAWVTDPHLDHLTPERVQQFFAELRAARPDALLLGGDIGQATNVEVFLRALADKSAFPIYFVLGNHDYYYGSFSDVEFRMRHLMHEVKNLFWLPEAGVVRLTPRTALVGSGGWADARHGEFMMSPVQLNDYAMIEDLAPLNQAALAFRLNELGDRSARELRHVLPEALAHNEHVLVLMHVPPFKEACWHGGQPGNEDWLPHFTCAAAGEALIEAAARYPQRRLTVLCGHTHGEAYVQIRPNLQVKAGAAEYGKPKIEAMINVT